jgi:molybdenum cofactor biosynthesis protein B
MAMSYREHKKASPGQVRCAVLTVSDTRDASTDTSGRMIQDMLREAGHEICHYAIVKDEPQQIRDQLLALRNRDDCQAVLINGGTGIAPRDGTVEVVTSLLDKRLDGFGELFRMLSFSEIGSGAMMSRAVGGIMAGRVVFSMPGSNNAVSVAMSKLILPELGHLVWDLNRPS